MPLNQFPRRAFAGSSTLQTFTGNGTQTAFTLSSTQTQNELFLFVDDVVQVPGVDFTVNGTTLTFTIAPPNAAEIIARGFGVPSPVTTVSDGSVTAAKLATGAIEAKLGYTPVSPTQLSTEVNNIIASAPGALNTLDELAAALGDDANYASTITTALSAKASTIYVDSQISAIQVTPTQVSDKVNTSTGYLALPSGTTAQRPVSPSAGMTRYNTTTSQFEVYQGGAWTSYLTTYTVEYLVIAGGGGGGNGNGPYREGGGGGGAGGYRTNVTGAASGGGGAAESPLYVISNTGYTVTVGAGGAGNTSPSGSGSGGASSTFGIITSNGGGGGGPQDGAGSGGGSGGGAGPQGSPGGSGTSNQGYAGGSGYSGNNAQAGGGGGAGAAGGNGSVTAMPSSGVGGTGVSSPITGSAVIRAGGGGGGGHQSGGLGGAGGGGNGAYNNPGVNGSAGTANTGGGGGGGSTDPYDGQSGGSGIVIIRYLGSQRGTGGTVTSSGGYTIHTFTSSSTFTA
jgi:hypothetical protein